MANMPLICLCLYLFIISHGCNSQEQNSTHGLSSRAKKQLGIFTVVKFSNDICTSSTSGRNGTCYTNSECAAKGGSSSGSCASSFGVCCVFEKTCGGGSVAENCTYFTSSSRTAGASCSLTICKCSSDVCQLRLDFETFTLSSPYTATTGADATKNYATKIGNCVTDFFSVSVPGGKAPPLICGANSGQHIYVPATDSCNTLSSFFGTATTTTTSAFTIKITQVKCNAKNRAPENCLQYYTASAGTFSTFNYDGLNGKHLANQDYCYCIRAERSACTICYSLVTPANGLGLGRPDGNTLVDVSCGYAYGIAAEATTDTAWSNFDHIVIPNSQCDVTTAAANAIPSVDRYCGTAFNCVTNVDAGTAATTFSPGTVCSSTKPFQFCLKTDGVEAYKTDAPLTEVFVTTTTSQGVAGFEMRYWQKSSCLLKAAANA